MHTFTAHFLFTYWPQMCTCNQLADADVPMTKCFQERDEAETTVSKTGATDVFVPECNSDGTFSEVQCHGASGYCWCVSDEGKPFPRTSTKNGRPNCKLKGNYMCCFFFQRL
jgi:hypothetical protein